MKPKLIVYNTLTRKKEAFKPLNEPFVGMYVCGPTVYGEAHLGHARPAVVFDVIYRYLQYVGYKVRYVRNITDVGHLENDADEGEDKIAKKAKVEQLEPMEIAQQYTNSYHRNMEQLNTKSPGIEPHASGHIIEQIEMVSKIIDAGFAYVVDGSVYFDVIKYSKSHNYGKLSGRVLDDLITNTRELDGQSEKRNSVDFALWKKASPEHIMKWPSPWSVGFPGWHLECSAMGAKYLGVPFDIHGGGMDLLFPHHECEIAQGVAAYGQEPVKYWLHNNMITINGQKMGKSLNNFITLNELFSGNNKVLEKAYSPMTIRFFILQAHYRGTLDFSNEALQSAEKGMNRLLGSIEKINKIKSSAKSTVDIKQLHDKCCKAMDDDFNTPIVIASLFDGMKIIDSIIGGKESVTSQDLELLKKIYNEFIFDILGLKVEEQAGINDKLTDGLMDLILTLRQEAKNKKDFQTSDAIRNKLNSLNIQIKDTPDGAVWECK